jgi:two-component system OmpR family response regulator
VEMHQRHDPGAARILVVDDEPEIRELLGLTLAAEGWLVEEAASGPEALERCRRESFDIVVLDYLMPGMNGLDVARRLLLEGIRIPTVIFTAYLVAELRTTCHLLGLSAVDKVNWQELVLRLRSLDAERVGAPAPIASTG